MSIKPISSDDKIQSKNYREYITQVLSESDKPMTTKEIYQRSIESGLIPHGTFDAVLRRFRKLLSKIAILERENNIRNYVWRLKVNSLGSQVWQPNSTARYNKTFLKNMVNVISYLIKNGDIPPSMDVETLKHQLKSFKLGLELDIDINAFIMANQSQIPPTWNVFVDTTEKVLVQYDKLPEIAKELCGITITK